MRPVCSASGMNSSGAMSPRSGWCQRSRPRRRSPGPWPARPGAGSGARARRPRSRCAARRPARRRRGLYWSRSGGVGVDARVGGLGRVHRHVGPLQEGGGVVRRGRAPRRCRCWRRPRGRGRRRRTAARGRGATSPAIGRGVLVGRHVGEQDGELVAAEPGDRVAARRRRSRSRLADLAQQLVADVVAERVVDLLEAVEVDQEDRDLVLRPRLGQRLVDAAAEQPPVRQGGEGVVEGLVLLLRRVLPQPVDQALRSSETLAWLARVSNSLRSSASKVLTSPSRPSRSPRR